jgi:hypothetical protein
MDIQPEIGHYPERRKKPRFQCDYPANVQGFELNGEFFQVEGRVVNLSRNGVNIRLSRKIPNGMEISIRIAFPTGLLELGTSNLAVHGKVVRSEALSETLCGVAVKFQDYRFL